MKLPSDEKMEALLKAPPEAKSIKDLPLGTIFRLLPNAYCYDGLFVKLSDTAYNNCERYWISGLTGKMKHTRDHRSPEEFCLPIEGGAT
jgi:hypothetical protein